jgi:predicted amidohydrolase YtcJ
MTSDALRPKSLREAHAHIAAHGHAMSMERFEACTGPRDFLERLARAASSAPRSEWLLGGGVRVEGWSEPRWPTLKELDDASIGRPLCVWSFDHHALVVNTVAMREIGLARDAADPPSGRIVRDERGDPTGLMLEAAAKAVWTRLPAPSPQQCRAFVTVALADLARHGFVEVHDLLSPPWLGPLLGELEREGRLSMRVRLYPALADLDETARTREQWESDRLHLAGAKLFADGTLNSRTAWMLQPYADPLPGLPTGEAMLSREDLAAAMVRVWSQGLGLAVHAIGDGAVRAVLDAFEMTSGERQRPVTHERSVDSIALGDPAERVAGARRSSELPPLRIEHAEIIDEADIPRFARLGVVASVQPCHLLADIEALRRHLPHRLERVLPLRDLIDSGCAPGELLWFGSDTPIVQPHPEDSIQAATQRRRSGAAASESIGTAQGITPEESWSAFGNPSA